MHRNTDLVAAGEAARALGISLDTLRRWDRRGRIRVERDAANRRVVPRSEIDRLRGGAGGTGLSARNRLRGEVREVRGDGMVAMVEIEVLAPARVVALITREAADDLGLRPGAPATAVIKATSVMVER
jgi:molybdopterin-binding protein